MKLLGLSLILAFVSFALPAKELSGKISIDGSSTVYLLSEAVAESARTDSNLKNVRVGVSVSGTGGGFQKFCNGEIDIAGASRPIKETEIAKCEAKKIRFHELPVAYDGIAVVVNKQNTCAQNFTTEQLKKIWSPEAEGKITNWKQIDPKCPDMALKLFGPGHDSGTFDYFTEAVVGESKKSRKDFTASEDDNVLVVGVAGEKGGLGYFGMAYYLSNKDKVRDVTVNGVEPTLQTIANRRYQPLSRPLFIYVSEAAAKRPEVDAFVKFYISKSDQLSQEVGYAPLGASLEKSQEIYGMISKIFDKKTVGTNFHEFHSNPNLNLEDLLKRKL